MNTESNVETGEVKNLIPASLLMRCSALAVDLCLTVSVCTLGFALMSMATPADSPAAKLPILLILVAACVYVGWGRMRYVSLGRELFRLQIAHMAEPSARPARPLTVHRDAQPVYGTRAVAIAATVITTCVLLTTMALTQVLSSTTVFAAVQAYTQSTRPFEAQYDTPPVLSGLPTALLIGDRRAYVQVGANWGERSQLLDYYLIRRNGQWQVQAVHQARERLFMKYTLKAHKEDIPPLPQ
jgi:hypothetical protein